MLLKEYMKTHSLIMDGAMGTYFAKLDGGANPVCEFANLENPELIRRIHLDYLEAGADLLRTNTFAAVREILAVGEEELIFREGAAAQLLPILRGFPHES